MFEKNDERVTFKMPDKIEMFKDIEDLNTDDILTFFIASKGDEENREGYVNRKRMTHYSKCLKLGPEYEQEPEIELVRENEISEELKEEFEEEFEEKEEDDLEYFNTFPTREDVIDHYLDGMIFGKPFLKQSKLTYDKEEGTVMFEKNDERVTSKMPHKMERFKDIEDLNTDDMPPFFIVSKGDTEKGEGYVNRKRMTHYSECLKLGPEYERGEGIIKTIKFLNGKSDSMSEGGVT
ncbi:hypothetical protein Tco_0424956 [Tanacetum coccineum]